MLSNRILRNRRNDTLTEKEQKPRTTWNHSRNAAGSRRTATRRNLQDMQQSMTRGYYPKRMDANPSQ